MTEQTLVQFAPHMAVLAAENTKLTSAQELGLLGLAPTFKTTNLKTLKLTNTLIKVLLVLAVLHMRYECR